METSGLQRRSETHNKAMKNDEADGCSRRVHSINFIKYNSEYHPFNCNNAVLVGPLKTVYPKIEDKLFLFLVITG